MSQSRSHTTTVHEDVPVSLRLSRPAIDAQRLNDTLQLSCQWGATPDGGMDRLALNDDDARVRRWYIGECEKVGCQVTVDAMGNIFAVRPGKQQGAPIAMGSHLDTQPTGGRYDGILGCLAALEVLRACHEAGYETIHPLVAIVWTNEEGARFIPSMLGSAVWAGMKPVEFGHSRTDDAGVSVREELERHNFLGVTASSHEQIPLKAHFELHIEQGPILDTAAHPVAVVTGVQAFRWFEIKVKGRGSHAGTTPMHLRHNPLTAFCRMALSAEELAVRFGGLATIGRVGSLATQSTNCILDDVVFHLDIRHHDDDQLNRLEAAVRESFAKIVEETLGVRLASWEPLTASQAVQFDPLAVDCVRHACKAYPKEEIISGAGHDSVNTSKRCPTAMIFIRCKDGVSHHPSEYSTPEDIAVGGRVLLDAVCRYDSTV
ncbi:amidase [Kwoniella heveanensis CBS 569]|nr:amidase [Kwoniella heveanensis CBS 569]